MNEIYLSRICIENFRTFGKFDVSIPAAPGLVLLTGTNGLGKSSFFDAIEWGLTGTVRRFDQYLKPNVDEGRYLTRRTAPPNSHKVLLGFSEGDDVARSALEAPARSAIIQKLKQQKWGPIHDIGTYLAFTHFLGQAAQQRFTSRESPEQWEALKGPSGIDKLEKVRQGLRGRATQLAFTRRIDREKSIAEDLQRRLAEWQAWRTRLERLQQAASATGALSSKELADRITALEGDIATVTNERPHMPSGATDSQRLTILDDHISQVRRSLTERRASLDSLSEIPTRFVELTADAQVDGPAMVRVQQAAVSARLALDRGQLEAKTAAEATQAQIKLVETIKADIATLEAARVDLERRNQLVALIEVAKSEEVKSQNHVADRRSAIAAIEQAFVQESNARSAAAQQQVLADAARKILENCNNLARLETSIAATATAYATAAEGANRARAELVVLNAARTAAAEQLNRAEAALEVSRRRAGDIAAAVARLSTHIHESDTNCPLCNTFFEPGELKLLAETAAASGDAQLASSDTEVERLRTENASLRRQASSLDVIVERANQVQRQLDAERQAALEMRTTIATALQVEVMAAVHAIAAQRDQQARNALAEAKSRLQAATIADAGASARRTLLRAELQDWQLALRQAAVRTAALEAEQRSCAERLTARGQADVELDALTARIQTQQAQLSDAQNRLRLLAAASEQKKTEVAGYNASLNAAEREVAQASAVRSESESSAAAIATQWAAAGLDSPPSQASLEAGRASILNALGRLDELSSRQHELARSNEATLLQQEIDEIVAAMTGAGGEAALANAAGHEQFLVESLKAARIAQKLTSETRTAVNKFTNNLKKEATEFSTQFLVPLNKVIDDFNEAMLSTPGETIRFNAEHRVDATRFEMMLHYRDRIEDATFDTELPPQVVLSEGQLAANGFSILCAASTAYPWSRWRALLLDDPLQHNDIIHTAAFVDVMRNMVELQGYQLIMSSHDRSESDFIARKFDAAGLPCSTIALTSPSAGGVRYDGPIENRAAAKARQQGLSQQANQAG